ncbi:MAG: VWA domain-containing protein [Pseudomonadota bacterium]
MLAERTPADWACRALAVAQVCRSSIGGIVLRGGPGEARSLCLQALRDAAEPAPWCIAPSNIDLDRLLGGLDLSATLATGKPVLVRGVLASADGGWLQLNMAERQAAQVTACVAHALDTKYIDVARDGLQSQLPADFAVVALDESREDEDGVALALRERLALTIETDALRAVDVVAALEPDTGFDPQRMAGFQVTDEQIGLLASSAAAMGEHSPRIVLALLQVARAVAAIDGAEQLSDVHLAESTVLVLAMRHAMTLPAASQETDDQPPAPPPPPSNEQDSETALSDDNVTADALPESIDEAIAAQLPADLLMRMTRGAAQRRTGSGASGAGNVRETFSRGRPLPSRRGVPGGGKRVDLLATLKSAAPMQLLRRQPSSSRLQVRKDDLRIKRFREPQRTTTLFVVDASGSAAVQRLAETKGAIELLLAECYVRRDQVALIAFRDANAVLELPPTRSLVRAKRVLADLAGGGATPLAAGLKLAAATADAIQRKGETPVIVLLSDARANMTLAGEADPATALSESLAVAKTIAESRFRALVIDTGRRPTSRCASVADAMLARYVPLPFADAVSVSGVVSAMVA